MPVDKQYVVIQAIVVRLTAKAACLAIVNEPDDRWVPRSVIEDGNSLEVGDDFQDVHIAEWFVRKEGIND